MDILLLTTPSQHTADNPAVERNASRLKQWIAELPIMDVVKTVRALHAAISPFNELPIADAERLKLLEVYRQGFEDILFTYDECRLRVLPLSPVQRDELAQDIIWLYLELANGYKILVRNGFDEGLSPAKDTLLLQAIYRAMELIAYALLYARRVEKPVPPLARLDLHQLYAFAEAHGVLQTRLRALRRETAVPTVARIYTQYLLMEVLDTEGLNGVELMELFMLLEEFSSLCHIAAEALPKPGHGVFGIDLMADEPPRACDAEFTPGMLRVLEIQPMRDAVEAWLEKHQADTSDLAGQDIRLLKILVGLLGSHWGRRRPRYSARRFVKVALGVEAVAYFLADRARLKQAGTTEVYGGIEVLSLDDEEEPRHGLGDWQVVDQSKTGCLLVGRVANGEEFPREGTLLGVVGFAPKTPAPSLSVGVVRWQGDLDEGQVKLGVEIIEGAAQSIAFGLSAQDLEQTPRPGFYFPKNVAEGRSATLLLPRLEVNSLLHVRVQGKTFEVETASLVREAAGYMQCCFRVRV